LAIRHLEGIPEGVAADPLPFLRKAFETVGMAKVSTSAKEARELGFLRPTDRITLQRDFLIQDAKNTVLAMNREGYEMPSPRSVACRAVGLSTFAYGLYTMKAAGRSASTTRSLAGRSPSC